MKTVLAICFFGLSAFAGTEKATLAGGCFWCMESPFDKLPGVSETLSGYTGGKTKNPTYEQVSTGTTGHYEAVQITFDPQKTSFEKILDAFWKNIDPTDTEGQFVDKGSQYRTAIFYHSEAQKKTAEASRKKIQARYTKPIATQILPASEFYAAEDYHQNFYKKNPQRYEQYRRGSGRPE